MSNLLILETSARRESVSSMLAHEFAQQWQAKHSGVRITRRVLAQTNLPNLDEGNTNALRSVVDHPSTAQAEATALSDSLIGEVTAADAILIAAPMHNFTISGPLLTWLDYVVRPGLTFGYGENGPEGKLTDRPVYVFSARGGQYGDGSVEAPSPYDCQTGYLRHILGFIGLKTLDVIAANGMDMGGKYREQGLAEARAKMTKLIQSL